MTTLYIGFASDNLPILLCDNKTVAEETINSFYGRHGRVGSLESFLDWYMEKEFSEKFTRGIRKDRMKEEAEGVFQEYFATQWSRKPEMKAVLVAALVQRMTPHAFP